MHKYEIGDYLYGRPMRLQEGPLLNFDASGLTLVIPLDGMTETEVKKLQKVDKITFYSKFAF
jgi:hypothetical protein